MNYDHEQYIKSNQPIQPTFSVGDWVSTVVHDTPILLDNNLLEASIEAPSFYGLTIWQPQPGDWCWLDDGFTPYLRKFSHTLGMAVDPVYVDVDGITYDGCSPFIGTLPTMCQSKDN